MRYNVKTFKAWAMWNYDFKGSPIIHQFNCEVPECYALDYARNVFNYSAPIVQPVFKTEQHEQVYLHTLQQKARAAFHQQEQDAQEN